MSHYCYGCDRSLLPTPESLLCASCFNRLHFLKSPAHFPRLHKIYFERAFSLLAYEGDLLKWIRDWKYNRHLHLSRLFLEFFDRADFDFSECHYIVPVPLHFFRRWKRGFNQAAVLALDLGKKWEIPILHHGIKRIRYGQRQVEQNSEERLENVKNLFAPGRSIGKVVDKSILLIDDVTTTGATLNACAKVLKQGKARSVTVLTLARTL